MTFLVTADTHLTDNQKDEHRFGLFPWLVKQQQQYKPEATFILGDLTQNKDRHSARLVNRMVDNLLLLQPPVYILKGNHDFVDPNTPYFGFLNHLKGVEFVSEPTGIDHSIMMIPHCPNQAEFAAACRVVKEPDYVMLHACIEGAIAETGARLTGLRWPPIDFARPPLLTLAGDIHRPQTLDCGVTYVGAPYHIRFGDDFTPRVLLVKDGKEKNLYFPAPRKWALTIHNVNEIEGNEDLRSGDQVRLTLALAREDAVHWADHKLQVLQACKGLGLEVHGIEVKIKSRKRERLRIESGKQPQEVLTAFCAAETVADNIREVGEELLR